MEKREESKKKTMDRLLKKKDSKVVSLLFLVNLDNLYSKKMSFYFIANNSHSILLDNTTGQDKQLSIWKK